MGEGLPWGVCPPSPPFPHPLRGGGWVQGLGFCASLMKGERVAGGWRVTSPRVLSAIGSGQAQRDAPASARPTSSLASRHPCGTEGAGQHRGPERGSPPVRSLTCQEATLLLSVVSRCRPKSLPTLGSMLCFFLRLPAWVTGSSFQLRVFSLEGRCDRGKRGGEKPQIPGSHLEAILVFVGRGGEEE